MAAVETGSNEGNGGTMTDRPRSPLVRVGMVHYINTAPIHEMWKEHNKAVDWVLVEDHPAALNRKLADGAIDLGFVSSYEYGIRPERYQLLSDLSISANGPVGSVFLFSRVKPEDLAGRTVLLSHQSQTSVCLVRIVLERFLAVVPDYVSGDLDRAERGRADGVLAIGDEALRLKIDESYAYCLDLGEMWQRHTGLPFVFGVCAVREAFCRTSPELVAAVHRQLIACRDAGVAQLDRVCRLAAPRIPMEVDACHSYLRAIEYDLDRDKRQALEVFFTFLAGMGEASAEALPLKILGTES